MSIDQIEELKSIIMGFRVSELTQLLTFCNQSKFGRKPVLQSRALDLLKNNNLTQKVQFKIRELSLQQNGGIIPSHNHSNKTIPEIPLIQDSSSNECTITEPEMMSHSIGFNSNSKSHVHDYYTSMPKLDLGNLNCNVGLMPTVRFKSIPFDDLLYTIIQPTALHSLPISKQRFNSYDCHFRLKAEEANEISMTREFKNNKFEFSSQIHLRFCQIETKSQDDLLPLNLNVKLNNKSIPLPSIIQNNKPNVESKRQSKPIDLTPFCKISPVSNNQLNITWTNDINQKNFCFTVCLIKKLTSNQLLDKLNLKGATDPLDTQKLIISKLTDTDNEISTTSLKCNLNCPLGKMRLRIPVRSTICNHIQCFDAELYLQMNEKRPSWLCPVCDKKAEYWTLFIDGLFTQILKEAPADSNEIEFSDDGSWKVVKNLNKTVTLTPQRRKIEEDTSSIKKSKTEEEEEIIELSSDSEDDNNENLNQCSSLNMAKISTFGDSHTSKSINSLNSYLNTPFNQFSTSLTTISQSNLDNRSQSRGLITRTSHAPNFGNNYNVNHLINNNNNFPMGSSNINRNSEPNVISID